MSIAYPPINEMWIWGGLTQLLIADPGWTYINCLPPLDQQNVDLGRIDTIVDYRYGQKLISLYNKLGAVSFLKFQCSKHPKVSEYFSALSVLIYNLLSRIV